MGCEMREANADGRCVGDGSKRESIFISHVQSFFIQPEWINPSADVSELFLKSVSRWSALAFLKQ